MQAKPVLSEEQTPKVVVKTTDKQISKAKDWYTSNHLANKLSSAGIKNKKKNR